LKLKKADGVFCEAEKDLYNTNADERRLCALFPDAAIRKQALAIARKSHERDGEQEEAMPEKRRGCDRSTVE